MKKFVTTFKVEQVEIEINGQSVVYEVREMTAANRDRYLDKMAERLRFDGTGRPAGLRRFENMHSELLTLCMFAQSNNQPVTEKEIQSWPASTTSALFQVAQEINRLNDDAAAPKKG